MPELPEVQTVVNDLNQKIIGKIVAGVWTDNPKLIRSHHKASTRLTDKDINQANNNFAEFKKNLIGRKVLKAERKGKNILIYLSGNRLLLIHQKMTGHMLFGKWKILKNKVIALEPQSMIKDPHNRFIHLLISFKDGSQLALSDMRKFAKAILASVQDIHKTPDISNLGPDALDPALNKSSFSKRIKRSGPSIKQALLKPELIAGIGNIYADESLYMAKIHPLQDPKKLSEEEIFALYSSMKKILRKAIRLRGTSTSDFRDTAGLKGGYTEQRLVYGREGQMCQRCETGIKRIKVGGRSSHFCPLCQKAIKIYVKKEKEKTN